MRAPYFRLEIVAGPGYDVGGINAASVIVDAVGPHDTWQLACGTELSCLRHGIRELAKWPELAAAHGTCTVERELDYFTPIEGRFELALMATPAGPAIEVRETSGYDGAHPSTRVAAKPADLAAFVDGLFASLEGQSFGAALGLFPTDVARGSTTRPLVHIGCWHLRRWEQSPSSGMPVALDIEDFSWAADVLLVIADELTQMTGKLAASRQRICERSGLILKAMLSENGDDDRQWSCQLTVGTPTAGPAWTIRMSAQHCRDSAASVTCEGITLYGYVSERLPL